MTELDFELDFTADGGWFEIRGRGWVAAVSNRNDELPLEMKPADLLNRYVLIDGKEYFVTGVETQGYSRRNFGLLIRGKK